MTVFGKEPEGDFETERAREIDDAVAPYEKQLDEAAARERALEADFVKLARASQERTATLEADLAAARAENARLRERLELLGASDAAGAKIQSQHGDEAAQTATVKEWARLFENEFDRAFFLSAYYERGKIIEALRAALRPTPEATRATVALLKVAETAEAVIEAHQRLRILEADASEPDGVEASMEQERRAREAVWDAGTAYRLARKAAGLDDGRTA